MRRSKLHREQPKRQPAKEGKSERSQKQSSTSKRERNAQGDSKRKSQKKPSPTANRYGCPAA